MPSCEFGKAGAGLGTRSRDANGGEHVMRRECRLKQALEEFIGLDHSRALWTRDLDLAAEREQTGGQLGGRIREGDGSAKGPAVAYGGMANVRHGQCNEREVSVDFGGPFKLRMTHQRADFDVSVLDRNCAKAGD